jgi:hypothetical protein
MPVIETHPETGTGLLPEERIAIPVMTASEAEQALLRGHHTRIMTQPIVPPKRRSRSVKSRDGSRKKHAKAGTKGARRVHTLIEEGHKNEEEHRLEPKKKKSRVTKAAAKRRTPKAGSKRATPPARTRRATASRKVKAK